MLRLSRARAWALVLFAVAGTGSTAAAQRALRGVGDETAPAAATASPSAVLSIDGQEVPAQAYARWLIEEVGPPLVREFAEGWALEREARARGLEVDPDEVAARLDAEIAARVEGAFLGDRAGWVAELARLGRSREGYRLQRATELRALLAATALAAEGRVVPEEKIRRDWELEHGPRGRAFVLDVLKVQVEVPPPRDGETGRAALDRELERVRAEGRARALELRARLRAGEDFAALARAVSDDEPTRGAGGRVPRFGQYGWPDAFVEALFALERGELSEPLFARGGWWLVRVVDWTDTPLESVRARLEQRLLERGPEPDEVGAVWNAVAARTRVEVLPGMLAPGAATGEEGSDPAALRVDGEAVPRSSYARWLLATRGEASWQPFVESWLVERRAAALGVEVGEAEVSARVRESLDAMLARSYQGQRDAWRAYLAANGRDERLYLAQLAGRQRRDLLVEKLILAEREVDEADVRALFERRYGAQGRRVQARVILLEVPRPQLEPGLSREQLEARLAEAVEARRADAQALVERVRRGEDFATLARRFSEEPMTRERGGELEGGFRPDAWPADVARAVLALPRGAVSEPLLADRWWALFELVDAEPVALEQVREGLREELRKRRPGPVEIAAYRNVLLQAAEVELLPGLRR
jgi:parvulin-like peptidyl-prolyl isomerase